MTTKNIISNFKELCISRRELVQKDSKYDFCTMYSFLGGYIEAIGDMIVTMDLDIALDLLYELENIKETYFTNHFR